MKKIKNPIKMLEEWQINRNTSPPYTNLTIKNFEAYQDSIVYEPYTCFDCNRKLIMKIDSLYCPCCSYKQTSISPLPSKEQIIQSRKDNLDKCLLLMKKLNIKVIK